MLYSIDAGELSYNKARELIKILKRNKIEANITAGGISLYPENGSVSVSMFEICEQFHVKPYSGVTAHESNVI